MMTEGIKKLDGNFDQEEFFKNGFDVSLRNLLETEIFKRSFCVHSSPVLVKARMTLPFKFKIGSNEYQTRSARGPRTVRFNVNPEVWAGCVQIVDPEIVNICKFYFDDFLNSLMNGLQFIDLAYLRIVSVSVHRDTVYESLFYDSATDLVLYVTAEIELFFLVKLLLPGSADFFLNNFKSTLVNLPYTFIHDYQSGIYRFENGHLVILRGDSLELPWQVSNDWQNHFLHFYVAKKLIPVKDFVGTNELGHSANEFKHHYFCLTDPRGADNLAVHFNQINTKYVEDGFYPGLNRVTIEHEQDLFEVSRSEAVTGFCEPRYLVRGFYDDEPLSAEVLINLIRFYLYYTGTAFRVLPGSTFSLLGFRDFVRARIMRDPKSLDPVVYEGGTVKGPFKICRLVPYVQMKSVPLEMIEMVRENLPLDHARYFSNHTLSQLIAAHGGEAVKLIISRPTDYVWCLEY